MLSRYLKKLTTYRLEKPVDQNVDLCFQFNSHAVRPRVVVFIRCLEKKNIYVERFW